MVAKKHEITIKEIITIQRGLDCLIYHYATPALSWTNQKSQFQQLSIFHANSYSFGSKLAFNFMLFNLCNVLIVYSSKESISHEVYLNEKQEIRTNKGKKIQHMNSYWIDESIENVHPSYHSSILSHVGSMNIIQSAYPFGCHDQKQENIAYNLMWNDKF